MFSVRMFLLLLVTLPFILHATVPGAVVSAEDEILASDLSDGEEDTEATVENDDASAADEETEVGGTDAAAVDAEAEEEEAEKVLKPSPDAETMILFTEPISSDELPVGRPVRFLVGFTNKGNKDFIVDTMDAAFRYPQDWSYYIQNFTTIRYAITVEPGREATFNYAFLPSENLGARPFGLTVNVNYHDNDGNAFADAVFNRTVNVYEPDDGLDGETFFLYIFLAAVAILLLFGAYQLWLSFGKKRLMSSKPRSHIETGTQSNKTDVDFDWIPKETLDMLNKSPGRSPKGGKTSPRQRAAAAGKRRGGAADD